MKKIIALSVLVSTIFCSIASAELTPVNNKFFKEFKKGTSSLSVRTDNEQRNYEDDNIKVYLKGNYIVSPLRQISGNVKKQFVQTHSDGIYNIGQGALMGSLKYLSVTGVALDITNKTNEVMLIDLNKSVISIGGYQGRPVPGGIKYMDAQTANLPPVVIMPGKTITKELFRGDMEFVDNGVLGSEWVPPCDLSVGKNIFGDGTFLLAIGEDKVKFVPMSFYREIDRNSLAPYLAEKK